MAIQEDPPAGVPDWIVTYGDMMSLLLTFFIMLVSLSEVQADQKYRAVLEALYQRLGYRSAPVAPPGKNFPLNSVIEGLKSLGSHVNDERGRGGTRARGPDGTEYRVYRRRDGTALAISGSLAFADGSDELSPSVKEMLKDIVRVVAGKPHKIEVRGHTSTQPLDTSAKFKDKFELAYARARKVAEFLENQGIAHNRLRVGSAGDGQPATSTGRMSEALDDRVEILVFDSVTREFSGIRDLRN